MKLVRFCTALSAAVLLLGAVEAGATYDYTPWGNPFLYRPEIVLSNVSYQYIYSKSLGGVLLMTGTPTYLINQNGTQTTITKGVFALAGYFYSNGTFDYGAMSVTGSIPGHPSALTPLLVSLDLNFEAYSTTTQTGSDYLVFSGKNNTPAGSPFYNLDPNAYVEILTTGSQPGPWSSSKGWQQASFSGKNGTGDAWAPIPPSVLLFGGGLAGVFGFARRKARLST